MKMIVVVALALVAAALAAPVDEKKITQILRSEFNNDPDGAYQLSFETDDGTKREETGEPKEVVDEENKPHTVVVVRGSYSYIDPEGNPKTITYFADETGFHAEGESVPKGPSRR